MVRDDGIVRVEGLNVKGLAKTTLVELRGRRAQGPPPRCGVQGSVGGQTAGGGELDLPALQNPAACEACNVVYDRDPNDARKVVRERVRIA